MRSSPPTAAEERTNLSASPHLLTFRRSTIANLEDWWQKRYVIFVHMSMEGFRTPQLIRHMVNG